MCVWAQARATPEKEDSQSVAMTAHFQVWTFEVRTLFQVVYWETERRHTDPVPFQNSYGMAKNVKIPQKISAFFNDAPLTGLFSVSGLFYILNYQILLY